MVPSDKEFIIMSIASFDSEELSNLCLKYDTSKFEDVDGGDDFPEVCLAVTKDLSQEVKQKAYEPTFLIKRSTMVDLTVLVQQLYLQHCQNKLFEGPWKLSKMVKNAYKPPDPI